MPIIVEAVLDIPSGYIMAKRVYSPLGISPTVTAISGSGQHIKVIVREDTYEDDSPRT